MDTKERSYSYMWLLVLRFMAVVLGELRGLRLHGSTHFTRSPVYRAMVQLETDIVKCYRSVEADLHEPPH